MSKVYLIGDLHGSFKPIRTFNEWNQGKQTINDTMIVLGDFGGNFCFDYHDRNFKEKLGKYHITYFVIRGNHDARPTDCMNNDSANWHAESFFDNTVYVENKYPYIKYAMDKIFFYKILGQTALVIPGAYSVDKYWRIKNKLPWFENEQLNEDEQARGEHLISTHEPPDIILSHTCPKIYVPTDLFLKDIDQSMIDTSMEEYLGQIEYQLPPYKLWAWGHYHETRIYPTYEGRQPLMLFNDAVLNLNHFLASNDIYKGLKFIDKE